MMTKFIITFSLAVLLSSCFYPQKQNGGKFRLVGSPCEGCEAVYEYGNKKLSPVDTLPDFNDDGLRIIVTGTIYQNDGKTPAKDVVLYIYHTDQNGIYAIKGDETGWAKRHGNIRGWVKTASNGTYKFYTLKPGRYPNRSTPAHIHATILEPSGKYYWLGSYHFEGDPFLKEKEITPESPRGGSSGLLKLREKGNLLIGERDIILGRNIPGYE
jgi:protocatechuate 3,4-dioxygenase beta subunit